jgi:hypothetical protein
MSTSSRKAAESLPGGAVGVKTPNRTEGWVRTGAGPPLAGCGGVPLDLALGKVEC